MSFGFGFGFPRRLTSGGGLSPSLYLDFVGTNSLPSTVTFSRGTNATLTDSNGRVAYAPHNLLTNSEDFEAAAWVKTSATIASNNALAPDGTTTADTFTAAAANAVIGQAWVSTTAPYTFSIWMRRVSGSGIIEINGGASWSTATLTSDWQRISVTQNVAAGVPSVGVRIVTSGDVIQVWGAQLNIGSTAQSYNSTTPKNLLGFTQEPENAAWTKSNSYVQQNLLTWSQDFDNAAWLQADITVTANSTVAPDGTTTADNIIENTANALHRIRQAATVTNGTACVISVFARAVGSRRLYINLVQVAGAGALFDLTGNGTVVDVAGTAANRAGSIQPVGNGWYRCTLIGTGTGFASVALFQITQSSSNTASDETYTGNGTSGLILWGAQLVQGSTAGDYTQTTSAAAPTRYVNWDGTLTGRKLVEDTATGDHRAFQAFSVPVIGVPYTYAVYAKAAERSRIQLTSATGVVLDAVFDLATGTVVTTTSGTAAISNAGGGWYRCAITNTSTAAVSTNLQARLIQSGTTNSYTGDGTSGIYVSDFQLSNSASVDPYVYNPQAAAASTAYYGPRFDYDPVTLAAKGLLIEEQRTNLLLYSEAAATSPWGLTNVTASVDTAVAPDGATTADTLTEGVGAQIQFANTQVQTIVSGQTVTLSRYVKRGTGVLRGFRLECEGGANGFRANFNPDTGAVSSSSAYGVGAVLSSGSEPAANGFRRYYITGTLGTSTSITNYFRFTETPTSSNIGYTGDGIQSFVVWGAQLEAGSFATSYIPTAASQVTRNADSASMLGDNFYTWYNPNQGTLSVEATDGPVAATAARGVWSIDNGTTANRLDLRRQDSSAIWNVVTNGGIEQALFNYSNTAVPGVTFKNALAYQTNNIAGSLNGGTIQSDVSAAIPAVSGLRIGVLQGATVYFNGTIRRIGYYNTRLPNSTLQALTT